MIYYLSIPAGETKSLTVAGERVYFETGDGPIIVKTIGQDTREIRLSPGMGFVMPSELPNFYGLEVKNDHSAVQRVGIYITYSQVFDNRAVIDTQATAMPVHLSAMAPGLAFPVFAKDGEPLPVHVVNDVIPREVFRSQLLTVTDADAGTIKNLSVQAAHFGKRILVKNFYLDGGHTNSGNPFLVGARAASFSGFFYLEAIAVGNNVLFEAVAAAISPYQLVHHNDGSAPNKVGSFRSQAVLPFNKVLDGYDLADVNKRVSVQVRTPVGGTLINNLAFDYEVLN